MILALALFVATPLEMRLPAGGLCPDAAVVGGAVSVVYGDGKNGWLTRYGSDEKVRINSVEGTVHAGGERGPKIAVGAGATYVAWQGDYRQGPHVWFARDVGKGFEPQKDLLVGKTPGLDQVAIAAQGKQVVVMWLDGRGGQDPAAPVTSTIWYSLSTDGGQTFGPNRMIEGDRACACCTFSAEFVSGERVKVLYRSGIANVRDIFVAEGSPSTNRWTVKPVTSTGWKFEGCPMDGPRLAGAHFSYMIDGKCYADGKLLGPGKYANVSRSGLATWQSGERLFWKDLQSGENGSLAAGPSRAALVERPDGPALIIHG